MAYGVWPRQLSLHEIPTTCFPFPGQYLLKAVTSYGVAGSKWPSHKSATCLAVAPQLRFNEIKTKRKPSAVVRPITLQEHSNEKNCVRVCDCAHPGRDYHRPDQIRVRRPDEHGY